MLLSVIWPSETISMWKCFWKSIKEDNFDTPPSPLLLHSKTNFLTKWLRNLMRTTELNTASQAAAVDECQRLAAHRKLRMWWKSSLALLQHPIGWLCLGEMQMKYYLLLAVAVIPSCKLGQESIHPTTITATTTTTSTLLATIAS